MLNEDIAEALEAPYKEAEEKGIRAERRRIVSWLATLFPTDPETPSELAAAQITRNLASAIDAGEHLPVTMALEFQQLMSREGSLLTQMPVAADFQKMALE